MREVIAIVADENYAAPAATLIRSVAANWEPRKLPTFRVLGTRWSRSHAQRLLQMANKLNLRVEFAPSVPDRLPVRGHWNDSVYARLGLAESCSEASRVVCLDSDIVVLTSLHSLFTLDLGDRPLAAVRDPCVEGRRTAGSRRYFNSGVLVVEMSAWTALRVGERCRSLLRGSRTPLEYLDQDALNQVLEDNWQPLDRRWNVFHFDELASIDREAAMRSLYPGQLALLQESAWCLHFVGPRKPWRPGYPLGRNKDRYDQYASAEDSGTR